MIRWFWGGVMLFLLLVGLLILGLEQQINSLPGLSIRNLPALPALRDGTAKAFGGFSSPASETAEIQDKEVSQPLKLFSSPEVANICNRGAHSSDYNDTVERILEALLVVDCSEGFSLNRHIETLNLARSGITELAPLSYFEDLRVLNLSHNEINDISSLSSLYRLEFVDLSHNHLSSTEALLPLKSLKILHLSHTELDTLQGFQRLKSLEKFFAEGNQISDISPVSRLPGLNEIRFWSNPIEKYKTKYTCPRGRNTAKVIRDFCAATQKVWKSARDLKISKKKAFRTKPGKKTRLKEQLIVFPAHSVEVWKVNRVSRNQVSEILSQWIEMARKSEQDGDEILSDSKRINEMMRDMVDGVEDEDGSPAEELSPDDVFLVAASGDGVQGLAILSEENDLDYAKNIKYLSVAPHNLGAATGGKRYRYVGSSLVEKALEMTDRVTLEPGSPSSSAAYQRMGFSSLHRSNPLRELGDGIIQGEKARNLREKLAKLRNPFG